MDKKMIDTFCKLLDNELDRLAKQPSLDNTTLNQLHMLTDTKKNLLKIEHLEMELGDMDEDDGYSRRGRSYRGNSYAQNMNMGGNSNSYMPTPQYYSSYDNGYSRGDAYSHLEQAMRDARSEAEREEIRQIMARYPR